MCDKEYRKVTGKIIGRNKTNSWACFRKQNTETTGGFPALVIS
jgi:hypothetical protein